MTLVPNRPRHVTLEYNMTGQSVKEVKRLWLEMPAGAHEVRRQRALFGQFSGTLATPNATVVWWSWLSLSHGWPEYHG